MKNVNAKEKKILKEKIDKELIEKGFEIENGKINSEKMVDLKVRHLHEASKKKNIKRKKDFLLRHYNAVKHMTKSIDQIEIGKIDLEIRFINNHNDEILFRWWNYIWWSLPFERGVGKQIRYFVWDKYNDLPVGLVYLASPTINVKEINTHLNLNYENKLDYINRSLSIIRLGALPPYNGLLGGKLIALSVLSDEVRDFYNNKYNKGEDNGLLYVTTTGAYGKSSILNRLKYKDTRLYNLIGSTSGCGTFHISDELYTEMLDYSDKYEILRKRGIDNGSSNKITNMCAVFREIGCPNYIYHNIKRTIYLQAYCTNIHNVIENKDMPKYFNWSFDELYEYWKERWLKMRLQNVEVLKKYDTSIYFKELEIYLKSL